MSTWSFVKAVGSSVLLQSFCPVVSPPILVQYNVSYLLPLENKIYVMYYNYYLDMKGQHVRIKCTTALALVYHFIVKCTMNKTCISGKKYWGTLKIMVNGHLGQLSLSLVRLCRYYSDDFWGAMNRQRCSLANFWSTIRHIKEWDRSPPFNSNE